jgi:UDP-3-O-[3-hydroxymyristoyl] glucosamine N-acyltransferase
MTMLKKIYIKEIIPFLDSCDIILGNTSYCFDNVQPSESVNENSLDWINDLKKNKIEYLINSKAKIIICDYSLEIQEELLSDKCIIKVKNPKLFFLRVVDAFFTPKIEYKIHPTAIIHPEAKISKSCLIGPNTYIGKSVIEDGAIIHGNNYIYDSVYIGRNVIIHAGTVIGGDGFGYQRNNVGAWEKFPHLGGVIINENVEIGANATIDRGTLGNTIIEEGVKIDNLVHIAHNVKIGKHSAIAASTIISGSVTIGEFCWISPSVSIKDQLKIGATVTIGIGSKVFKNIPENQTWVGNPAKPIEEYTKLQLILRKIQKNS